VTALKVYEYAKYADGNPDLEQRDEHFSARLQLFEAEGKQKQRAADVLEFARYLSARSARLRQLTRS
jgi:hypothetical protein